MEVETEIRRNAADIAAVANTVTRLATVQENAERQRAEDRDLQRKMVDGLNTLNEKISVTVVMQESIKRLTEAQAETKSDVRTLRHDHANTKNAVQGMPILGDKLTAMVVRVDSLEGRLNTQEAWRDKMDGAGGAFKVIGGALWAVFGTGLIALGLFIFKLFFKDGAP